MLGRLVKTIVCDNPLDRKKAQDIIKGREILFVAELKGHIPRERINECINFLPIIRNKEIVTNKETIGEYMYDYMKKNNIKLKNK